MYRDLYYLVKFLPAYALPAGIPTEEDLKQPKEEVEHMSPPASPTATTTATANGNGHGKEGLTHHRVHSNASGRHVQLPLPITTPGQAPKPLPTTRNRSQSTLTSSDKGRKRSRSFTQDAREKMLLAPGEEDQSLMPAYMPPKYHIFDLFPLSLLVKLLTSKGKEMKGKKAARLRAKMQGSAISHNLPLEISLYLVRYHFCSSQESS